MTTFIIITFLPSSKYWILKVGVSDNCRDYISNQTTLKSFGLFVVIIIIFLFQLICVEVQRLKVELIFITGKKLSYVLPRSFIQRILV